jgi:hypothetical protein
MRYEWNKKGKVWDLHRISKNNMSTPDRDMWWDSYYPIGRIRRAKNKNSCKKFIVERLNSDESRWEYITLLVMKLDEAKDVARTILIAGANDD